MITGTAGHILKAALAATLFSISAVVCAEQDLINYAGKNPSTDDLIEALAPPESVKTRGLSLNSATGASAAAGASTVVQKKVNFDQITFELNSDRINPKGRILLDKIGQAIASDQLSDVSYTIEGHTDASGSLAYNIRLSARRADSVKRYLVETYQIDPSRLKTAGRGPTDLLDKANPESGVNRRVVFLPIASK